MLVFSHLKSEEVEGSDSHALPLVVGLRESSTLVAEPLAHVVEKTIQLLERRPTHVDRERQLRPDRDCLWLTTDKTLGGGRRQELTAASITTLLLLQRREKQREEMLTSWLPHER